MSSGYEDERNGLEKLPLTSEEHPNRDQNRDPNKFTLLAFGGGAGMGKSTATQYLVDNYGFRELAFAKPLKDDVVKQLFQLEDKYLYDQEFKEQIIPELGVSVRDLLQVIGTQLLRQDLHKYLPQLKLVGDSIWIHIMYKNIEKLKSEGTNKIIVSDKRFLNEYENLKKWGFKVYDIYRAEKENKDPNRHESEKGAPYDELIDNNGTLEELYEKLDDLV